MQKQWSQSYFSEHERWTRHSIPFPCNTMAWHNSAIVWRKRDGKKRIIIKICARCVSLFKFTQPSEINDTIKDRTHVKRSINAFRPDSLHGFVQVIHVRLFYTVCGAMCVGDTQLLYFGWHFICISDCQSSFHLHTATLGQSHSACDFVIGIPMFDGASTIIAADSNYRKHL